MDAIELRGLRVSGTHGVLPEERTLPQPFEVDLDLELDLRRPGLTDDLADTVDYGAVAESVAAVVGGEHADLLEHLAERIARAVVAALGAGRGVKSITVTVRKLRPPVAMSMASAGVRIRRQPDEFDDDTSGP